MNKFKLIILSVITMTLISCNGNQQNHIEINQQNTELPIIFRLAKDNENHLIRIQLPKEIQIKNNSFFKESFVKIDYHYYSVPMGRDLGIGLFEKDCNSLKSLSLTGKKTIPRKSSLSYIYYTRHYIDSSQFIQSQLRPYVDMMMKLNQDTIAVETVAEFKLKHGELLRQLTDNDSISIQFLYSSTKSGLGERIAVPVNW